MTSSALAERLADELLRELAGASSELRSEVAGTALAIVDGSVGVPPRIPPILRSLVNRRELEELVARCLDAAI